MEAERFSRMLNGARDGDEQSFRELVELIHEEFRKKAERLVRGSGGLAQPTSVLVEFSEMACKPALLDDMKKRNDRWDYFCGIANKEFYRMMYRRRKSREKEFGDRKRVPLDIVLDSSAEEFEKHTGIKFEDVYEALEYLKRKSQNPKSYEALTLSYFGGFTQIRVAEMIEVDPKTVRTYIYDAGKNLKKELETRGFVWP